MALARCNRCGNEITKTPTWITGNLVEVEPSFCRVCGNAIAVERLDDQASGDGDEYDEEFSLYDFDDLEEIVRGIVPENYRDLTPGQLEKYAVQTIWKRLRGIEAYPVVDTDKLDTSKQDEEYERQMQIAIERGSPPGLILAAPTSMMDKSLEHLERQYHLVWVNGLVGRTHLKATPREAQALRTMVARSYYLVVPCDCDKVTYIPDETNPNFMRKA